jgi:hypothetical protein
MTLGQALSAAVLGLLGAWASAAVVIEFVRGSIRDS